MSSIIRNLPVTISAAPVQLNSTAGDVTLQTNSVTRIQLPNGGSPSAVVEGALKIVDGTEGTGKVLTSDSVGLASWQTPTGGSGTPAGATGDVQFNSAGSFAADNDLFWDNTNKRLGVGTNTPGQTLHVVSSVAGYAAVVDGLVFNGSGMQINGDILGLDVSVTSGTCIGSMPLGSNSIAFDAVLPPNGSNNIGVWIEGGGMVSANPLLKITDATQTQNGDMIFANANINGTAIFTGNLLTLQVSGSTLFSVGTSGAVTIADGSQGARKVLTSDAAGLASWQTLNFVAHETPGGAVNNINTVFLLANTPITGSEMVYLNGQLQDPTNDYTISGASITFVSAPRTGDRVRVAYRY